MKLVEQHIIKKTHKYYADLKYLCHLSKNLYNAGLYEVRQYFFKTQNDPTIKYKYLNYFALDKLLKETNNHDYYALPVDPAQQTLRIINQDFQSFFKLLCLKQCGKYSGKVNIPKYKKKDGYFNLIINSVKLGKEFKETGLLTIPRTKFMKEQGMNKIQLNVNNYKTCSQVRFIPKNNYIIMEVIYEKEEKQIKPDNNRYLSIDLGINNLCTCTNNCKLNSFIIDGKKLKHINQYFNKRKALLQSKLNKNQYTSKLINNITRKRNFRIKNYLHNVSKYLINYVVSNNINTIIIGKNNLWKQEINIGKVNNQNFIQIPFNQLINMIYYKAKLQGINVITQEESYTSKVSFFDNDYIPVYGVDDELFKSSGKRKYRGLFITSKGLRLNADINGSLNIMRKYLKCNCDEIISPADVGFVVNPVKVKFI